MISHTSLDALLPVGQPAQSKAAVKDIRRLVYDVSTIFNELQVADRAEAIIRAREADMG
ncbi:MAG: hypothetical protein M5U01_21025 [Ardenticatenaceae bacterium]|nr:hypothetical protein [Ardenticatenaceae bacterium]